MTRMVERWFPSAEVSANSNSGWGSGNQERNLFVWFAARPAAQAKAAVICSLLPWPDEESEQKRLQELVKAAMKGRYAASQELREEIIAANPGGPSVLDPFSGRGMIPLEVARLGLPSFAIDYSHVAVLATELLTEYPFRDWSDEPRLPFGDQSETLIATESVLIRDVRAVLDEVGSRLSRSMAEFFPRVNGKRPWGYLWAVTLPCQECGRRFPLVGSYELRKGTTKKATKTKPQSDDPGQSFYIEVDQAAGTFSAMVHEGPPRRATTLANAIGADGKKIRGKSAICPFCSHPHPLSTHQRLAQEGFGQDSLLVVADLDYKVGKTFREPTAEELVAAQRSALDLSREPAFAPNLPAIPDESIPENNGATIRPQLYGAGTYGDLMCSRQTLSFIRLSRAINEIGTELASLGFSPQYIRALTGYAGATLVRALRYSTRGAWVRARNKGTVEVAGIFVNESTVGFSYDFFETGIGEGPGTWRSMADGTVSILGGLFESLEGKPVVVGQGSAAAQPFPSGSMTAVVTDPPYDAMVYYTDSSDFFYVWLKRALLSSRPEMSVTADPRGLQDKTDEIIVKEHGKAPGEHRDRTHYDTRIGAAFAEMRRVVADDGVVTIVFGHGEPEVWQRLLGSIQSADLVMTGSWPANTESGGQQGKANIQTTLTMACRPAPPRRPEGRKGAVESEMKTEIGRRFADWERWGLAPTDMLMASSGPAMEIVGKYWRILDSRGESVDISTFLPLARAAVQDAMAVEIDDHPLDSFDARTRFALWWVRLYGRDVAPKSELRWQTLAASMELGEVRDLVPDAEKGCQFVYSAKHTAHLDANSAVIDVALALASVSESGVAGMWEVMDASARDPQDAYLWAAVKFLADRLPDSDVDSIAFTRVLRNRSGIVTAAQTVTEAFTAADKERESKARQGRLL